MTADPTKPQSMYHGYQEGQTLQTQIKPIAYAIIASAFR